MLGMSGCTDDDKLPRPTYCPYCGYLSDHASAAFEEDAKAAPGHLNFCMSCGEISLFDEHMMLRRPTIAEFVRITAVFGDQIGALREALAAVKAEHGPIGSKPVQN